MYEFIEFTTVLSIIQRKALNLFVKGGGLKTLELISKLYFIHTANHYSVREC
jgi:hypothetical protein